MRKSKSDAIWVMFSWFLTAMIAFVSTAVVANLIYFLGLVGLALALAANLSVRYVAKKRSDAQEERIHAARATPSGTTATKSRAAGNCPVRRCRRAAPRTRTWAMRRSPWSMRPAAGRIGAAGDCACGRA